MDNATLSVGNGDLEFMPTSFGTVFTVTNNSAFSISRDMRLFGLSNTLHFAGNSLPALFNGQFLITGHGNHVIVENTELECSLNVNIFYGATDGGVSGHIFEVKRGGTFITKDRFQMYGNGDLTEVDGGKLFITGEYGLVFWDRAANAPATTTNTLRVANGGLFQNKFGWGIRPTTGCVLIEADGVDPETGEPSLCEPVFGNADLPYPGFTLRAACGGVLSLTNNANTAILMMNASGALDGPKTVLNTAGGEIRCGALQVNGANNGLAPVVTAAHGTGKVVVKGTATFGANTWVWPTAEKGAAAKEYIILEAGTLIGAPLLAPDVDTSVWRLRDENNKLYLRYSRGGTLFMLK